MHMRFIALGGVAIVVALTAFLMSSSGKSTDVAHQQGTVVPTSAYVPKSAYPDETPSSGKQIAPGIPAVQPRTSARPGTASFAIQDVETYLTAFPAMYWDSETPIPVVEQFEVMAARNGEARIQTTIFRPDGEFVVLVRLHGDFTVWGPPVPDRKEPAYVGHTEYLVFGAQNGNLLKIVMRD